jgi:hypothetical protein
MKMTIQFRYDQYVLLRADASAAAPVESKRLIALGKRSGGYMFNASRMILVDTSIWIDHLHGSEPVMLAPLLRNKT